MALVVFDRVQETTATTGTGTLTLGGAVAGFQTFAVIGNGNTTFYCIINGTQWEVGIGTYSTTGPTLARTTVLSNSDGNTSPITLVGASTVFCTYPSEKSVNLDSSGNVSPLGTITSGVWNGSTIPVAYGGTGVTASSGANSVVLRDSNQNITANNLFLGFTSTATAAGTTTLTVASTQYQRFTGTTTQTVKLPDATTLQNGYVYTIDNDSTGVITIVDAASSTVDTIVGGTIGDFILLSNSTVAGTWVAYGRLPANYDFGTTSANFGGSTISNATWNGSTIAYNYGGTGLTTFTAANYALYSTSASALTAGTLPVAAGGTGAVTFTANGVLYGAGTGAVGVTGAGTTGQVLIATTSGAPSWGAVPSTAAVTALSFGTTGLTPSTATTGSITVGGTLAVGNGGTGLSSTPANGALDIGNGTGFTRTTLTAGTGISVTNGAGSISIANTGVTSVSGTSPVASSGGATPAISLASAYGDTQNPYGSKTANYVLAAPNGSAGAPSFRALVSADIPSTYSEFAAGTALLFQQTAAPTGWTKVVTNNDAALRVVSGTVSTGGTVGFTTAFASQTPTGSVSTSVTGVSGSVATSITAVSGSVGVSLSSGGSVSLSSGGSVSAMTLATSQIPSHDHYFTAYYDNNVGGPYVNAYTSNVNGPHSIYVTATGGGGSHTHGFTNPSYSLTNPSYSGSFTFGSGTASSSFTFSSGTASSSFTGNAINLAVKYVDVIIATKN